MPSLHNRQTAAVVAMQTGEVKTRCRGHTNVVETAAFVPLHCHTALRTLLNIPQPPTQSIPRSASQSKELNPPPQTEDPNAHFHHTPYLITASRDKTLKLWAADTGLCLHTFTGHNNWVRAFLFHPHQPILLSASDDKSIRIWDLATGKCTKTIETAHEHFISALVWARAQIGSGDDQRTVNALASAGVDQIIKVC